MVFQCFFFCFRSQFAIINCVGFAKEETLIVKAIKTILKYSIRAEDQLQGDFKSLTYHWVQLDRSIPVRALHVRIAVFTSTPGSDCGFSPSWEGLQGPPIAKFSPPFPFCPTRNLIRRVGCSGDLLEDRLSLSSTLVSPHFWYRDSKVGILMSIT